MTLSTFNINIYHLGRHTHNKVEHALRQSNMAMENAPLIDDFPAVSLGVLFRDFRQCFITGGHHRTVPLGPTGTSTHGDKRPKMYEHLATQKYELSIASNIKNMFSF